MKLYICYGTFRSPRPGGHPCANAYEALRDAGHEFEMQKSYGFGPLPAFTGGRKRVQQLTGQKWVPALGVRRRDSDPRIARDHRLGEGEPRGRRRGLSRADDP